MTVALAKRLGLIRSDVEVVLTGGVFKGYDPALLSDLTVRIRRRVPGARLVRVEAPSVLGAALVGLDSLGDGAVRPEVESRLRKALTAWQSSAEI